MLFEGTFITNTIKALSSIATAQLTIGDRGEKFLASESKWLDKGGQKSFSAVCKCVIISPVSRLPHTHAWLCPTQAEAPVSDEIIW